ncbi:MAG: GNAT family N-acetyltransferase [Alphaproteobacteria bacterium]
MSAAIRPVKADDRERWAGLFQAYAGFYETSIDSAAMDAVWTWIHDETTAFWCAVAETTEDGITGFTQFQAMHRSLSGGNVCYLSDLFVDPAVRGHGTGRALIDHVRHFAAGRGMPQVRWLTNQYNHEARRLYDTYQPRTDFILYSVAAGQ